MNKKAVKEKKSTKKINETNRNTDGNTGLRRFPARLAGILLAVVAVVFLVYSVVSLVGIHSKLSDLRQELTDITTDIGNWERKNEDLQKIVNQSGDELSEYMEQIAHDRLDLVHEGERVFIVVSGD